jgi:hypothetical protein
MENNSNNSMNIPGRQTEHGRHHINGMHPDRYNFLMDGNRTMRSPYRGRNERRMALVWGLG